MSTTRKIPPGHKTALESLTSAFAEGGRVALMSCKLKATGEDVTVLCFVNYVDGLVEMAPVAMLFNDNPYDLLEPPT